MTRVDLRDDVVRSAVELLLGERLRGSDVELTLAGSRLRCEFRIDAEEHRRRATLGLGAVTSLGLLHALWRVSPSPDGMEIEFAPLDHATLQDAHPALVRRANGQLARVYQPPGEVCLLAAVGREPDAAIRRALSIPPVFYRAAVWVAKGSLRPSTERLIDLAADLGLGLCVVDDREARILRAPSPPEAGVPTVYRWWVSEVAYHRALYDQSAHAAS